MGGSVGLVGAEGISNSQHLEGDQLVRRSFREGGSSPVAKAMGDRSVAVISRVANNRDLAQHGGRGRPPSRVPGRLIIEPPKGRWIIHRDRSPRYGVPFKRLLQQGISICSPGFLSVNLSI